MDPISHAVIGSAVAGLLPEGAHPAVAWSILIGAEIPDIDFVIRFFRGRIGYLTYHRGPTHGLVILPVLTGAVAGLLHTLWPEAPFGMLWGWGLLGSLSHVLFDFGNDYGTQGLWPFSNRRIARDIIPIVDLWLLGIIALGWMVNAAWPGHRQLVFAGVWLALAGYVGLRFWLQSRARKVVAALIPEATAAGGTGGGGVPCGSGWAEERLTVHPTLLSLDAWRYVIRANGEYLTGLVWAREGRVSPPVRSRDQYDQVVQASLQSPVLAAFAAW